MTSNKNVQPQTNSKLFRPWDGKSNQDCTVTSTTSVNSMTISEQFDDDDDDDDNEIDKNVIKIKNEIDHKIIPLLPQNQEIHNKTITFDSSTSTSNNLEYFQQQNHILPIIEYGLMNDEFYSNAAALQSSVYHHIDPYTATVMEHEYNRIMAEEAQAKMLSARKQRPKKFKCPHCDVAFSNNGQLKGHVRIHTGERPFKCDDINCGKTFTRNEELTRHKRIHTGLRPYSCVTCGKRFGRRDHLKKHTKTHFIQQDRYLSPAAAAAATVFLPLYPYLYGY